MKKLISLAWYVFAAVLFNSCEPALQITSDYDKNVSFKEYKTFEMLKTQTNDRTISQLNVDRIYNAIKAEMIKKGFTENTTNPDLKVNSVTIFKDKKAVMANTDSYGYGGGYRPYMWDGGGTTYTTYDVYNYTDGSLIIEVIDAKTNKLIWEGIGNKEIDGPIKDPDVKIPAAVSKIMNSFPPGAATGTKK